MIFVVIVLLFTRGSRPVVRRLHKRMGGQTVRYTVVMAVYDGE